MVNFIYKIREQELNKFIINILMVIYCVSLLVSYKISGTIFYVMLILFLLNKNIKELLINALKNKVVQAILLYFSLHILWIIGSENLGNALYQLKKNLILLSPILFYATVKKEFVNKIFTIFLIVVLLSSIYSILMYFGLANSSFKHINEPHAIPFLYKLDFGFFLLTGIGYSFYSLRRINNTILEKILFSLFILIASIDIFLIGGRVYMFSYLCILLIFSFSMYKTHIIKAVILLILGIVVFIFMYQYNSQTKSKIDDIVMGINDGIFDENYNSSSGTRVGMIKYSLPVIKNHFLFGVGVGDHIDEVKKVIDTNLEKDNSLISRSKELLRNFNQGYSSHLHNAYIQTFVQFGLIGFLIWINIFYQIIKTEGIKRIYKEFLLFSVFVYLLACTSSADLITYNSGKFLIFIIAILLLKEEKYDYKIGKKNEL